MMHARREEEGLDARASLFLELAELRTRVGELGKLCARKTRQCAHKDRIISSLEQENAALKKHCEWLEGNLALKHTVIEDLERACGVKGGGFA